MGVGKNGFNINSLAGDTTNTSGFGSAYNT